MTRPSTESLEFHFSCRPRCCEWCGKRGTKENPLTRLFIDTDSTGQLFFWVHAPCSDQIIKDEDVTFYWNLDKNT